MVESQRCRAFVGMVASRHGASCCCQPMGRRSRFDPCMPDQFGVGWLACGLFTVESFFLQQFGRYPVVSAALWSACASWGQLSCSPRRCSRMSSFLSSRFVLGFAVAGLSDVVVVLRPGRAPRVVLVRRCRGRQWSARRGRCGGVYRPGRPHLVAVGCPLLFFPVKSVSVVVTPVASCPRVWSLCCCQHFVWYAVVFAAQWSACPAVRCVGQWWPCRVSSGCSSCVGPAWYLLTVRCPLLVRRVLRGRKVATIGTTAGKRFEIRYDMPCPALEAALHAQPIIWYFAVPFSFLLSFACANQMYTPAGGKAPSVPSGAPLCSP